MNNTKLHIDIITIFPSFFENPLKEGLIGKAIKKGLININIHNLRDFSLGRHKQVDDAVYGGGQGMVLKPEPLYKALKNIKKYKNSRVILTSPTGIKFNQSTASRLKNYKQLIIICGRYEGIDQRIIDNFVDEEISIGDYILNGGELASLVISEATSRLIKGFVGKEESVKADSFSNNILDHSNYTRPSKFLKYNIPLVLKSGNHNQIENWRLYSRISNTFYFRPDLFKNANLSTKESNTLKDVISMPKGVKVHE